MRTLSYGFEFDVQIRTPRDGWRFRLSRSMIEDVSALTSVFNA